MLTGPVSWRIATLSHSRPVPVLKTCCKVFLAGQIERAPPAHGSPEVSGGDTISELRGDVESCFGNVDTRSDPDIAAADWI